MTTEQIKELKAKLSPKGPDFLAGFAADRAALSAQLLDDYQALGELTNETRALGEYIIAFARELAADAEQLRE